MENKKYYLRLADRYFAGLTTPKEERRLRRFLLLEEAQSEEAFRETLAVMSLTGAKRKQQGAKLPRTLRLSRRWAAAAAVALLLGGGAVFWRNTAGRQDICEAVVAGNVVTDPATVIGYMHSSVRDVIRPDEPYSFEQQLEDALSFTQ